MDAKNYSYVAQCNFCGTSIYSDEKIHECSACGSNSVKCISVASYEKKLKKSDSYMIVPRKKTLPKTTSKELSKKISLRTITMLKIATIVFYVASTAAIIIMSICS